MSNEIYASKDFLDICLGMGDFCMWQGFESLLEKSMGDLDFIFLFKNFDPVIGNIPAFSIHKSVRRGGDGGGSWTSRKNASKGIDICNHYQNQLK